MPAARRLVFVLLALRAAVACGDTPTAPTPPIVVEPDPDPNPPRDIRPVHPQFDDDFWREFVYNAYDQPGPLTGRRSLVIEWMPNVWIWTLDDTAPAEDSIRRLFPDAYRELTGRPYTGRIESGPYDRNEWGWVTVEFQPDLEGRARGRALVGPNPGRIWMTWDGWWHFGPGSTIGHWFFDNTFRHEVGHALGFRHVSGTSAVMSVDGTTDWKLERGFTALERYHAQLAYEVGRGAEYCGWPFGASCATSRRGLQPTFGPEPPVEVVD